MSAAVESLIVAMGFDNKQFEAAVKISMATLAQLKSSLNFGAQKDPLADVQASVGRFSLNPVSSAIEGVNAKFLAMSTIGITALSNITNKAIDAGTNMVKALTISPITSGLEEYELNMNSIQTILANTQASGAGLDDVNHALDTLNTYADDTKYSFAEMAKNIGTFTAAGVDLDTSAASIKGIANLAALSGSNSQQASGAMYQLSQAISSGRVSLEDWNSVVNAGMGGTVFQRALAQTAEKIGTLSEGAVTLEGDMQNVSIQGKSFRESVSATNGESWLTSEVLTETLKQFTGDLSAADLAAQGFSESQIEAIQKQAETAKAAATEAKTFRDVYDSLKEGVGSGWSETWRTVIGDFEEAKGLWTGVYRTMDDMLGKSADARNDLLAAWKEGGGRDAMLDGLRNAFTALMSVVTPIKDAFREIFPPTTAASLISMSQAFARFTEKLIVGGETADKIKRTFAGVFAIFGIGWEIVKSLFSAVGQLFGAFQGGGGGILSFTAKIGDFLVKMHEAVKGGELFQKIFTVIATVISIPIKLLSNFGEAISSLMGDVTGATSSLSGFSGILSTIGSAISQFWNILAHGDFVSGVFSEDSPIIGWFFKIREAAEKFFSADGIKMMLGIGGGVGVAAGAGFGIKAVIQKMFGGGEDGIIDTIKGTFESIGGAFDGVSDIFESLTGSLTAMQNNLKASTLLKIAAAVGVLAVAILILSTINGGDLIKSMTAITVGFGLLVGAMAILSKIAGSAGIAAIPAIAVGMMAMSAAILILAASAKVLATMSWGELAKGLGGMVVLMAALVAGAWGLSKVEGIMLRAAVAMIPFAIGIRLLVMSVQALSTMPFGELVKGLGAVAVLIAGIGLALKLMPDNMPSIGFGLLLVGAGLLVISKSVKDLGNTDIGTLVQGILGIGGALAIIAGALRIMPKNMGGMAAGLMMVSVALLGISAVIKTLGGMSFGDLAKGIGGMAVALGVLALTLTYMGGTLAGSAALVVAAIALGMLIPSILALSMLSWGQLLVGMAGLAATLAIIGVAGLLMGPVVPILLALGIAIGLMGVGMLAIGLGALAFSAALTAVIGVAGLTQVAILGLLALIPQLALKFAEAILTFVVTIAKGAPALISALKDLVIAMLQVFIEVIPKIGEVVTTLLSTLVDIIVQNAPKIGEAVTALITTFLDVLRTNAPNIYNTMFEIMVGFLQTIRDRVPEVVTIVGEIIVAFIDALAVQVVNVVNAGINFIVTVLDGMAQAVRDNSDRISNAALDLGAAIVEGIIQGIGNGIRRVGEAAANLARSAIDAAKGALGINSPSKEFRYLGEGIGEGMVLGIDRGVKDVNAAVTNMSRGAIDTAKTELSRLGVIAQNVWSILGKGDFIGSNGLLEEDSPIVDTLFNIREGFERIGAVATTVWGILDEGKYYGNGGLLEEDSPIVDTLFNVREGLDDVGAVAKTVWGILDEGKYHTNGGLLEEDSPIVDTLFDVREGLVGVRDAAKSATDILTTGDFKGGPWEEDSPIVDGLMIMHEKFEEFHTVGQDAVQGMINGLQSGANDISKAAEAMAEGALESARDALGIRSPSREFKKIGEYSVEGLKEGIEEGEPTIGEAGFNLAGALISGFGKGMGKGGGDLVDSIVKVLKSGEGDLKIGGPNAPLTMQLKGLNQALKEADLQLAIFFGAVDAADPAALEKYVEEAGNNITYLAGLLDGLASSANQAFGMLEEGTTLDLVLGDEDLLTGLLNAVLSLIPGVEGAAIRLGVTVVNGLIGAIFGETLVGMVGNVITKLTQMVAGWFGYTFPVEDVEDDINGAEDALDNFLVTVEGGSGRIQKLTEEGVKVLKDALVNATDVASEIDTNPKITPVLELTQFNAAKSTMLDGLSDVSLSTSSSQASSLYESQRSLAEMQAETSAAATGNTTIEFNQTNTSPVALSHVDIYKNTKGQLAMAKEALGIS